MLRWPAAPSFLLHGGKQKTTKEGPHGNEHTKSTREAQKCWLAGFSLKHTNESIQQPTSPTANWLASFSSPGRTLFTAVAVVVHQDDLLQQVNRRVVDDAVNGSQDHRQGFVHKDEDHRDLWEVLRVRQLLAPAGIKRGLLACANRGCKDQLKTETNRSSFLLRLHS